MTTTCTVGGIHIGGVQGPVVIAGPCLLESFDEALKIGERVVQACANAGLPCVFKGSFDKANRSSVRSARGPGMETGLRWLAGMRDRLGIPVTTDIHDPAQAEPVAQTVDLLQIPAFLCRQTDLLVAAAEAATSHERAVNVKKGQFLSPGEMVGPLRKLVESGCTNVMVTERGTTFGYHRLINDFLGLGDLMELDVPGMEGPPPVCFDCTHSTQQPGTGEQTGGRADRVPLLARAATAAGVHALFIECHPDPKSAPSDGSTMLPLDALDDVLRTVSLLRGAAPIPDAKK